MWYVAGQILIWMAAAALLGLVVGWILSSMRARSHAEARAESLAPPPRTHVRTNVAPVRAAAPRLTEPPIGEAAPAPMVGFGGAPPTVAQLTADLALASDANDLQRQKIGALEQRLQGSQARLELLQAEHADTQDELDALRRSMGPKAAEAERLRRDNEQLRHALGIEAARVESARRLVDGLHAEHGVLTERLEHLRRQLGDDGTAR